MEQTTTKNCPFCGEDILTAAKKCKHCGQWLEKECPHCHKWIKITAKKCRFCKQWIDGNDPVDDDSPNNQQTIVYNIYQEEEGENSLVGCLGYLIIFVVIGLVAWFTLPSEVKHIEKSKTEMVKSLNNAFIQRGVRTGETVKCLGYYIIYGGNFKTNVRKALDAKYTF